LQAADLTFTGKYGASGDNVGTLWFFDKDFGLQWSWNTGGCIHSVVISKLYPCMFPYPNHDLAVTNVVPSSTTAIIGETLNVNITITNEGNYAESNFTVTLEAFNPDADPRMYNDEALIRDLLNITLNPGESKNIPFLWDTTGMNEGNYTLLGRVSILRDEIDVYDNHLINGQVELKAPSGVHDIAVRNVTTSTTIAKTRAGCEPEINVTIVNEGDFIENVTVTVYVNTTVIGTQTVYHMSPNSSTIISFSWNTTGFAKGNYTVSAYAVPVPGETDTSDNTYVNGEIWLKWPYDVTGDNYCGIDDIVHVAERFGTEPGGPPNSNGFLYHPIYDITCDDYIGIDDVVEIAEHFGETDP